MRKRIQKIIGLMLVIFASCFCGLVGCKDKYANMTIQASTKSIELFLDEADNDGKMIGNSAEVSVTVGGVDGSVSKEVLQPSVSSPDIVAIKKVNMTSEGTTKFLITANEISSSPVVITFLTKEGGKSTSIEVTVTRKVTEIATNQSYKPFAVVGEGSYINTSKAIVFAPQNTSQKDVVYSIKNANGHTAEITENGYLTVTEKNGSEPLIITATSKANPTLSCDIEVKVIKPITDQDFKLYINEVADGNEITDSYNWSVLDLESSEMKLILKLTSTENVIISSDSGVIASSQKTISAVFPTGTLVGENEILLSTTGSTGSSKLKLVLQIAGYDYKVEKQIAFTVSKLPNSITVNGEDLTNKSKTYDIYDKYQNKLGQKFEVKIGDDTASDRRYKISVPENEREQISVKLSNGEELNLTDELYLPNGTIIFVSAKEDYTSSMVILEITNMGGYKSTLKLNLRTAAQMVDIKAYGENETTLFVEKGKQITLQYDVDSPKAYVNAVEVKGYDKNIVEVSIEQKANQMPTIIVKGLTDSQANASVTSLYLQLPNGYKSKVVNVYVFTPAESVNLTAPTETNSTYGKYIADYSYQDGNLTNLVLAKGGISKLDVLAKNGNQNATVYSQVFNYVNESDKSYISINNEGYINARYIKTDDEGKMKFNLVVKTLKSVLGDDEILKGDAEVIEHKFEFTLSVFEKITSISLDKQFINLNYANNLWIENNEFSKSNLAKVNLSIYPANASADEITWEINNLDNVDLQLDNEKKSCMITAKDGNEEKTIILSVFVKQLNKIYSKNVYITLKPIVEPQGITIEGVKTGTVVSGAYQYDAEQITSFGQTYASINGQLRQAKEIYLDSRKLTQSSFIEIISKITNDNATNKKIVMEVVEGGDLVDISLTNQILFKADNNGIKSGKVAIRLYAEGSITNINTNPRVVSYVVLTIADGKTEQTAFQISNENDFWNMFADENLKNHYYLICDEIFLTKPLSQAVFNNNGYAPYWLNSKNGEKYTIHNLNIDIVQTMTDRDNNQTKFAGLFGISNGTIANISINAKLNIDSKECDYIAVLTGINNGKIVDVDFTINSSINLINQPKIIIGGVAGINNAEIENISIYANVLVDANSQVVINNFVVGGIVAVNNGRISQSNVEQNLTIQNIESNTSRIGGLAGENSGEILQNIVDNSSVIANGLSNVGGLVGFNYANANGQAGLVKGNVVNCEVVAENNVGGLIGLNKDSSVSSNIVELYETNKIFESTLNPYFAISGNQNVAGLIGKIGDESVGSNIEFNYVKTYSDKIYIKGNLAGGLVGHISGNKKVEQDDDGVSTESILTNLSANFAYVNLQAENAGGLVAMSENAVIKNSYTRGKINSTNAGAIVGDIDSTDNLVNIYSTIELPVVANTTLTKADVLDYTVEKQTIVDYFNFAPWTVDSSLNDGYPILENNGTVLERKIPQQIVIEAKNSTFDEKFGLILQKNKEIYEINDLFNFVDGENTIDKNELIFSSSNKNVFAIKNGKIVFKSYGSATLTVCSKYIRTVKSQVKITFVREIKNIKITESNNANAESVDKVSVQLNKTKNIFAYAFDSKENLVDSEDILLKIGILENSANNIEISNKKFDIADNSEDIDGEKYFYNYFSLGELLVSVNSLENINAKISLVQKIDDDYVTLVDKKDFSFEIFKGIESISVDKQSVNLTSMNEVSFTVKVVADVNSLQLDYLSSNSQLLNVCNLTVIHNYDEINGKFVHTFDYTLKVKDEYLLLNSDENNQRAELKEGFESILTFVPDIDSEKTVNLVVEVSPQELLKIDVVHFPNGMETTSSTTQETFFEPNELPSNTITPGEFSMLMIDIYPEYANFDEIEVYYEATGSNTMTFMQMAYTTGTNENNIDINKFLEVKPSALIQNQKIILSRVSSINLDSGRLGEYAKKFDGRYYVKTLIPTNTVAGTIYSIIVKTTTYGKNGEPDTTVTSSPLKIEVLPVPTVTINTDAQDYQLQDGTILVARGTTLNMLAQTTNYSKNADVSLAINTPDGTELNKDNFLVQNGNGLTFYVPLNTPAGTEVTITTKVSTFINGIEVPRYDSVKILVVDYLIKGITTDQDHNSINIISGETEIVKLKLVTKYADFSTNNEIVVLQNEVTTYKNIISTLKKVNSTDPAIQDYENKIDECNAKIDDLKLLINKIEEQISQKEDEISLITAGTWKWKTENLGATTLDDISTVAGNVGNGDTSSAFTYVRILTEEDKQASSIAENVFAIKGLKTRTSPLTNVVAEYEFTYGKDSSGNFGVIQKTANNTATVYKKFDTSLEIYVVTGATMDNPTPIYTVSKFLSMTDEDYILMNDLYITSKDAFFTEQYKETIDGKIANTSNNYYYYDENTRFTSITPNFKSLDGNSYKIYINSFALDETSGGNYGFFNTIPENCILKNVEIVYLNQKLIGQDNQATYTSSYKILAEDYTSANYGLFAGTNAGTIYNSKVSFASITSSGIKTNYYNGLTFTIELDENITAVAGGFVGVNNGYISNSKIGTADFTSSDDINKNVLNIKANGTVAGFVGSNQNKISASYAFNVGVVNTSKNVQDTLTAGFVADNTASGKIYQSFAEGRSQTRNEEKPLDSSKMQNKITSLGNVAGFVYQNYGSITDSYSNVPLSTPSRSAGFVYQTSGKDAIISECFSTSKAIDQIDTTAFRYFTGTNEKSEVNIGDAKIKNCYYLSDTAVVETDETFKEPAINITESEFTDLDKFYGFETSDRIWKIKNIGFGNDSPTLVQATETTMSKRIVSGTNIENGVLIGYKYTYVDNKLGTSKNPIIVYDAKSLLNVFNDESLQTKQDGNYIYTNKNIKLIKDIDLENYAGTDELKKLQTIVFTGTLDGNNYELQNVRILGEKEQSADSFGLFKQIGYINYNEKSETKDTTRTLDPNDTNSRDISSGNINSLTIKVLEVSKTDSKMVGVLAGQIIGNSVVTKVNIDGEGVTVEGNNMVGGLAGYVGSQSVISSITSNVSVTSAYAGLKNADYKGQNYEDFNKRVNLYNSLYTLTEKDETVDGKTIYTVTSSITAGIDKISYAGGIAGVIDTSKVFNTTIDNNTNTNEVNVNVTKMRNLKTYGNVTISGEIVGGVVGYLGKGVELYDSKFEIVSTNNSQFLTGKYTAGGIVGESKGMLNGVRADVVDSEIETIDENFSNPLSQNIFVGDTYPKYVGGLVGIMPNGSIENSYSKLNVISHTANYVGGLVGYIGSPVDQDIVNQLLLLKTKVVSASMDSNAENNNIQSLYANMFKYYGIYVKSAYTTGMVYASTSYTVGGRTLTDEIVGDGTNLQDLTAVPTNFAGGLYGKVNAYAYIDNSNNEILMTEIFSNTVGVNDWKTSIDGVSSADMQKAYQGTTEDRYTIGADGQRVKITRTENDATVTSTITYQANIGYFSAELYLNIKKPDGTNAVIGNVSDYLKTEIIAGKENLYLNNFISDSNLQISNQVVKVIKPDTLTFELQYFENKNEPKQYTELTENLRKYYRDKDATKRSKIYAEFDDVLWDKENYTYPRLQFRHAMLTAEIKNEDDLFNMANTSKIVKTYILKNDIYLTKNWTPIKGFRGTFVSGAGGPYTIYNINISSREDNVGFFGSTQNAFVKDINFVFGGRVQPDLNSSGEPMFKRLNGKSTGQFSFEGNDETDPSHTDNLLKQWDTSNGNYPFILVYRPKNEDNTEIANRQYLEGTFNGNEIKALGGIEVNSNYNQRNISALVGLNDTSIFTNISIIFSQGAKIDANGNTNFGVISAYTTSATVSTMEYTGITVNMQKVGNQNTDSQVEDTEANNIGLYLASSTVSNAGALFGYVKNVKTIKDIYVNSKISFNFINGISGRNDISVSAVIANVENDALATVSGIRFSQPVKLNISKVSKASTTLELNFYLGLLAGKTKFIQFTNVNLSNSENAISLIKEGSNAQLSCTKLFVGGLIGYAEDSILTSDDYSTSIILTANLQFDTVNVSNISLGGIIGETKDSGVKNVFASVNTTIKNLNASSNSNIGGGFGIISANASATEIVNNISNTVTLGNIEIQTQTQSSSLYNNIGGFVGKTALAETNSTGSIIIQKCNTATNIVNGSTYSNSRATLGGFIGLHDCGDILECLTINDVSGYAYYVGGFVGSHTNGSIKNIKSLTTVFTKQYIYVGGFVGYSRNASSVKYENCYYSYDYSGVQHNGYGIPVSFISYLTGYGWSNIANVSDYLVPLRLTNSGTSQEKFIANIFKKLTDSGSKICPENFGAEGITTSTLKENTCYIITDSIDLSDKTIDISITLKKGAKLIGLSKIKKDGNDENITIKTNGTFIDKVGERALVSNIVHIVNKVVDKSFVGFVNENNGTIFNCTIKSDRILVKQDKQESQEVSQDLSVASFAGVNNGVIANSISNVKFDFADVNASKITASGFVLTNNGVIANSYSNGEFNNAQNVAVIGFAEKNSSNALIYHSYSANICLKYKQDESFGFVKTETGSRVYSSGYDRYAFNVNSTNSNDTYYYVGSSELYSQFTQGYSSIFALNYSYNYGYPYLIDYSLRQYGVNENATSSDLLDLASVQSTGDGTKTNPYQITHAGKLDWIRSIKNGTKNVYFNQTKDIDMSAFGNTFTTIGKGIGSIQRFAGEIDCQYLIYNGNEYITYNLVLDGEYEKQSSSSLALFSTAQSIKNLAIKGKIINAKQQYVGGLVATYDYVQNDEHIAVIDNCFVQIDITVKKFASNQRTYIGGIIGKGAERYRLGSSIYDTVISQYTDITNSVSIGKIVIDAVLDFSSSYSKQVYVGGISGMYGNYSQYISNYTLMSIVDNATGNRDCLQIDAVNNYLEESDASKRINAFYDKNISLSTSVNRNSYNLANNWLNKAGSDGTVDVLDNYKLKGENGNTDNWVYSTYNYPVQKWLSNNAFALKVIGYQTDSEATNGTGSLISPYQINSASDFANTGDKNYESVVLMQNNLNVSSDYSLENQLFNGNGKTISSTDKKLFTNYDNAIVTNLTLLNTEFASVVSRSGVCELYNITVKNTTTSSAITPVKFAGQLNQFVVKNCNYIVDLSSAGVGESISSATTINIDNAMVVNSIKNSIVENFVVEIKGETITGRFYNEDASSSLKVNIISSVSQRTNYSAILFGETENVIIDSIKFNTKHKYNIQKTTGRESGTNTIHINMETTIANITSSNTLNVGSIIGQASKTNIKNVSINMGNLTLTTKISSSAITWEGNIGGVIGSLTNRSQFTNAISNKQNINISSITLNVNERFGALNIGGVLGYTSADISNIDLVNVGKIKVNISITPNVGADYNIGALAGKAEGCAIENIVIGKQQIENGIEKVNDIAQLEVVASIGNNNQKNLYVGGMIGYVSNLTAVTNCTINNNVIAQTTTEGIKLYVGGVFGCLYVDENTVLIDLDLYRNEGIIRGLNYGSQYFNKEVVNSTDNNIFTNNYYLDVSQAEKPGSSNAEKVGSIFVTSNTYNKYDKDGNHSPTDYFVWAKIEQQNFGLGNPFNFASVGGVAGKSLLSLNIEDDRVKLNLVKGNIVGDSPDSIFDMATSKNIYKTNKDRFFYNNLTGSYLKLDYTYAINDNDKNAESMFGIYSGLYYSLGENKGYASISGNVSANYEQTVNKRFDDDGSCIDTKYDSAPGFTGLYVATNANRFVPRNL